MFAFDVPPQLANGLIAYKRNLHEGLLLLAGDDEIKDAIEKGVYAPKERIPSELELAEQYEVSRHSTTSIGMSSRMAQTQASAKQTSRRPMTKHLTR